MPLPPSFARHPASVATVVAAVHAVAALTAATAAFGQSAPGTSSPGTSGSGTSSSGISLSGTSPPAHVNLTSSASVEVPKDLMTVVFSTTRDGADAATVQSQLKQALDAALAEARKAARPGQVEVQTGNFALYPRYGAKGTPNGWQGTTELVVEGRDLPAIGQLTGRISTLTIARVGYGLSRELRQKAESDVTAEAIARYRAKAADVARQFGYAGYTLHEINVSANEPQPPVPMAAMRMEMATGADRSLPVEAGKGTVTVSVSGSVLLTR